MSNLNILSCEPNYSSNKRRLLAERENSQGISNSTLFSKIKNYCDDKLK